MNNPTAMRKPPINPRDKIYRVGQRVKMKPFIDSNDTIFGNVVDGTRCSIFVKWEDKDEPLEHFTEEYKDIKKVYTRNFPK